MIEAFYIGGVLADKAYLGDELIWQAEKVITLDFEKKEYSKPLNDVITFARPSKAWLFDGLTINEYAPDVPRLSNGLLIEQSATNYAKSSFLPQDGSYSSGAVYYYDSDYPKGWRKAGSGGGYLYPQANVTNTPCIMSCIYVGNYEFSQMIVDNGRVTASKLGDSSYFYALLPNGTTDKHHGMIWPSNSTTTRSSTLVAWQIEEGNRITSPIKTDIDPVTRAADVLALKVPVLSITGDWDSTLNLDVINGTLLHSGYGYIRSLRIVHK